MTMRIAVAQMVSHSDAKDRNIKRGVELISQAAAEQADLVVLPEFFNVEYFAQHRDYKYLDYAEPLDGPTLTAVAQACRAERLWCVATILERARAGSYYDTAVLIDRDGEVRGAYRKTHPAAVYGLEKIYFRFGSTYPVFDVEGWRVGIMICYDAFFPEAARSLALRGAELVIAPFAAPKHPVWQAMHITRAFENGMYLAVCNKVGVEDEWTFAGESLIVSPGGELLGVASDRADEMICADLDQAQVEYWRRRYPMFRDRRPDLYGALVANTEDL
jgi:predicted amidohydrolase